MREQQLLYHNRESAFFAGHPTPPAHERGTVFPHLSPPRARIHYHESSVNPSTPTLADRAANRIGIGQMRAAPNLLSLLRLCLAPFLVLAVLDHRNELAFSLFVTAGVTDALDGLLARMLHQRTMLGQYLDPVVDKLLLSTLFLVLHHEGLISLLVTVLVFARDLGILMVAAVLYATTSIRNFGPSIFGKANTVAQILAVSAVLLARFWHPAWVVFIRNGSLAATVVLTVLSGFHYAIRATTQSSSSSAAAG